MIYFEFKTEASCEDKRTEISQLAPGYFDKSYENTVCVLDLDEDGI
jgi:hypothetical protein